MACSQNIKEQEPPKKESHSVKQVNVLTDDATEGQLYKMDIDNCTNWRMDGRANKIIYRGDSLLKTILFES